MGLLDSIQFDPEYVPGAKLGMHSLQIILAFVAWCLEIAVFRAPGAAIVGNNGWTFAVCFLSIPAWIYLIMTPRWERTRKFAEPHAMVAVDALFFVLWLSAFATQAAYNTANLCGTACSLSKAIVAMGVFVTLLWAASAFISAYTLQYYQFHGILPGYDKQKLRGGDNIDPDKAAFSMAPHDDEAYAPVQMDDHPEHSYGAGASGGAGGYSDNRYGQNAYHADDDDPNRYGQLPSRQNAALFDSETEYNSQNRPLGGSASSRPYAPPTAHDAYDDDRPAHFPAADYDRTMR